RDAATARDTLAGIDAELALLSRVAAPADTTAIAETLASAQESAGVGAREGGPGGERGDQPRGGVGRAGEAHAGARAVHGVAAGGRADGVVGRGGPGERGARPGTRGPGVGDVGRGRSGRRREARGGGGRGRAYPRSGRHAAATPACRRALPGVYADRGDRTGD